VLCLGTSLTTLKSGMDLKQPRAQTQPPGYGRIPELSHESTHSKTRPDAIQLFRDKKKNDAVSRRMKRDCFGVIHNQEGRGQWTQRKLLFENGPCRQRSRILGVWYCFAWGTSLTYSERHGFKLAKGLNTPLAGQLLELSHAKKLSRAGRTSSLQ
jgi:hypothetical protein